VSKWLETYRGVVNAWECDVIEHFTIAYYFDRLADASRTYLEVIDASPEPSQLERRLHVTFRHELRAGASFHITSAVIAVHETSLDLGHQFIDTATGKTVAWACESIPLVVGAGTHHKLQDMVAQWLGPSTAASTRPHAAAVGALTVRDRVKPWEIDATGGMSLPGYVHRFSAAAMQTLTVIGMTASYMQEQRRGFSTFELDLRLTGTAGVDEPIGVKTAIAHLGKSSLRLHHILSGRKGRPLASMSQSGVHLDMDARRSAPLPETLRSRALAVMAPQP